MEISESPSDNPATRASGSSFYAAMRIMPRGQRGALFEIYGFCRAVDDVADGYGSRAQRKAELAQWRADIDALYAGAPPPRLRGLAGPVAKFGLDRDDFLAIIDGMEMDVVADIRTPDMKTLDLYCDRVASAVGRLCVRVFGMAEADGIALAHHLGRALQLTNILRDLDEDAGIGRLYLPREALSEAGITTTDPALTLLNPSLDKACMLVIERALGHFREADVIMRRCPRRTVRAPKIMAEAYRLMLDRLIERGWASPRKAIRLGRPQLLWILVRHAVF